MGIAYCHRCQMETEHEVWEAKIQGMINGKIVEYIGKARCCVNCGTEIYDEKIEEYNLQALSEAKKASEKQEKEMTQLEDV